MNKKIIHFIETGFARGIGQSLDWWKHRLEIFEYYTLKSIMNQTNQNFHLLIHYDNRFPLVEELEDILSKNTENYFLIDKSSEDIGQIAELINSAKYVYLTRIDSDDLFHKDLVEEIQQHGFDWRRALILQKGYCYNCVDKKLQHYRVNSPPNSTIMYPKEIYIDKGKRKEYMGKLSGHDQVCGKFNSTILSENKYMVLVHGGNRRTLYHENAIELKRFEIPKEEHDEILQEFSISSLIYDEKITWKE